LRIYTNLFCGTAGKEEGFSSDIFCDNLLKKQMRRSQPERNRSPESYFFARLNSYKQK